MLEKESRYLLLVRSEKLEAHTVGFRGSVAYHEWGKLLHRFYDPFLAIEHYQLIQNEPATLD